MNRIRVLHVVQNLNYGGMERLIADIARRADPDRFESHVLTLEYLGRFAENLGPHVTVHAAQRMSRWSIVRPTELARTMAAIDPAVVHTHSGVWYKAGLAARLAGVPRLVHTEHGRQHPDPWSDRIIDRVAAQRTDVVVAVSQPLALHLRANVLAAHVPLCVIANGVDTDTLHPIVDDGAIRRELGIASARPIIGSVGRLEPIKGYDIMIAAFGMLRQHWKSESIFPALVLAGDGSERRRLEQLAEQLGVRDDVHFLGWRNDIPHLHATFELFTLSSRSEGTSVSLLEAMSAGVCPVVTNVGGNADVLGPELHDRLVDPESPDALAAAWYHALTDGSAEVSTDAALARQRVVQAFNVVAMVNAYESLYDGSVPVVQNAVLPQQRAVR